MKIDDARGEIALDGAQVASSYGRLRGEPAQPLRRFRVSPLADLLVDPTRYAAARLEQAARERVHCGTEIQRSDPADLIEAERLRPEHAFLARDPPSSRKQLWRGMLVVEHDDDESRRSLCPRDAADRVVELIRGRTFEIVEHDERRASVLLGSAIAIGEARVCDRGAAGGGRTGSLRREPRLADPPRPGDDDDATAAPARRTPGPPQAAYVTVASDDRRHGIERRRQLAPPRRRAAVHLHPPCEVVRILIRRRRTEHAQRLAKSLELELAVVVEADAVDGSRKVDDALAHQHFSGLRLRAEPSREVERAAAVAAVDLDRLARIEARCQPAAAPTSRVAPRRRT